MLNKLIFTVTLWDSYYYFNSANDELEAEKLNALSKDTASGCNSWYLNHIYLNTKHSFFTHYTIKLQINFYGRTKICQWDSQGSSAKISSVLWKETSCKWGSGELGVVPHGHGPCPV